MTFTPNPATGNTTTLHLARIQPTATTRTGVISVQATDGTAVGTCVKTLSVTMTPDGAP